MNWGRAKRFAMFGLCGLGAFVLISFGQRVYTERTAPSLSGQMKTACVGRYLIDLPATADVSFNDAYIDGFNVSSTNSESDSAFNARLLALAEHLTSAKNESGESTLVSSHILGPNDPRGSIFVYDHERDEIPDGGRRMSIDSVAVRGMARLSGLSIDLEGDRRAVGSEKRMGKLVARFRRLASGEVPHEPGFCTENAITREPMLDSSSERIAIVAAMPAYPDLRVTFSTMEGVDPAPGLLARNAKTREGEPFYMRAAITTLRERTRVLNGLSGEELALRVRESNLTTGYSYWWEMVPPPGSRPGAMVSIELDSGTNPSSGGKPVQSSLSEAEMTALWERIVRSIRLRPTKAGMAPTPASANAPHA